MTLGPVGFAVATLRMVYSLIPFCFQEVARDRPGGAWLLGHFLTTDADYILRHENYKIGT